MEEYIEGERLSQRNREKLIEAIVEYTTMNFIWIEQKEFIIILKIKELFSKEPMDLYYIPKTSKTCPSGGLFNAFRYAHSLLQKETGIKRYNKRKSAPSNTIRDELSSTLTPDKNEEIRKELIGRSEPWEDVVKDWVRTFP